MKPLPTVTGSNALPMNVGIINNGFSLTNKGYQSNNKINHSLAIRISTDGFYYIIKDNQQNSFAKIETFELQNINNEKTWINTIGILLKETGISPDFFQNIRILFDFPGYIIVPNELYDTSKRELFFKYNLSKSPEQIILADKVPACNAVVLHPLSKTIKNFVTNQLPEATIYSQISTLLTSLATNENVSSDTSVFVQINKAHFDLIIFSNNKLQYCNSFQFKTIEDFLYFLLYAMKNLSLDPDKQPVHMLGNIASASPIINKTSRYIRNIVFTGDGDKNQSPYFSGIENHQFYNLQHLLTCE